MITSSSAIHAELPFLVRIVSMSRAKSTRREPSRIRLLVRITKIGEKVDVKIVKESSIARNVQQFIACAQSSASESALRASLCVSPSLVGMPIVYRGTHVCSV